MALVRDMAHASVSLHPGPGEQLRSARDRRGLTLEQAAAATCITARYLRALEEDAPLHEFPAPVYARFFLREYARHLKLDEAPLLSSFDRRYSEELAEEEEEVLRLPTAVRDPGAARRFLTAASVIGLLLVIGYTVVTRGRESTAPPVPSPSQRPPAATGPPGDSGEHATPGEEGLHLVLELDERSWIEAITDGRVRLQETADAGRTIRLHADRAVFLTLGKAEGVRLTVNGDRVRTGDGVVRLTIRWRRDGVEIRRGAQLV